jgi:hypothetical protein
MKKVLVVSPHFPPSNLAGVHRSRLFAQYLPKYGWEPIILTIDERYYEERLDYKLLELVPQDLRIEKVSAYRITRPRIIGDIGLRGFFQLYARAKNLIKKEKIDFLLIHIPSYYTALLGRILHERTGIKYGIDYIDPWVHNFPGSEKVFSRAWFSSKVAAILEPIAIKKSSLITGVAEGYYSGVQKRNPKLLATCIFSAMPYGGEIGDHLKAKAMHQSPYLFHKKAGIMQLIYAGAMLPKAYEPLEAIFQAISLKRNLFRNIEFHFIGTGKSPNDLDGYNIKELAQKYGFWQTIIFEYPSRIPYLDVLVHLESADGIFILGSTEPHYTPSKLYQGVLACKPILAVLNSQSTAVEILENTKAGVVLAFNGEQGITTIQNRFVDFFCTYLQFVKDFRISNVDMSAFTAFSAENVTGQLAHCLDVVIEEKIPRVA